MEYWKVSARGQSILITCRGHDRERTIQPALDTFRALASERDEFTIIADLREMTGYESESRVHWQLLFREFRARIQRLVLVGARSALIRMGAATVGAFAGIPVKFVDSWDELEAWERSA
jgi:hypothetical protein